MVAKCFEISWPDSLGKDYITDEIFWDFLEKMICREEVTVLDVTPKDEDNETLV
ncbi:hypothetical protein LCGC14_1188590 [marine sediment metagenome]|uniref:Uncharacterized protein n=1 Tax=marine sediment metagenome TaxID=412755 RepID=A0A0F9P2U7_9ZZZZ